VSPGRQVSFATPYGLAEGYLTGRGEGRPAIVVIQEWWGLVPHITDLADRLAREGYMALAPDLYHGKRTVEAEEAHHLMQGLDWTRATAELYGAVAHLHEREHASKVGVVGFCMGGALTVLAAQDPAVASYVSFYGFPPTPPDAPPRSIQAPGLLLFGEHEHVFSVEQARTFAAAQQQLGIPTTIVEYPGAGHAFLNDTRPEVYHPDAAKDAWQRMLAHFARTLRSSKG
jgi:carboxymethylenebutenolidase